MKKRYVLLVVIAIGVYWFGFRDRCGGSGAVACPSAESEEGVGVTLTKAEVCPTAGYLCHGRNTFQAARWPRNMGYIRIRVSSPRFADGPTADVLKQLVAEGIRAWDGQPFPLLVDDGAITTHIADIDVVWTQGLYNAALGVSTVSWQPRGKRIKFKSHGLGIVIPPIPPDQEGEAMGAALRAQIKAIAIHEMGHALGLAHSDRASDIMWPMLRPEVLSPRPSQRDLLTVNALYSLPNGATVR